MNKQHTTDWNERFLKKDTPWEESEPSLYLRDLLSHYTQRGQCLLEVGCGLGMNARWFATLGYPVVAIDIAETAIQHARENSASLADVSFECVDFLGSTLTQKFDIVFDKGCLHTFTERDSYLQFAQQVAEYLKPEGLWINISGNADQKECLTSRRAGQYPRLNLRDLMLAVEPHFEVLEIKRGIFGQKNNFLSWIGVYQKRCV